jgi:hypothetical protein
MSKAKRILALAIFLPMLAACGDSSGGSGAEADGTAATSNDQYVKFAQCMRQNGVPNWPDPIDGDKFRMPMGSDGKTPLINPNSPGFKNASQKCKSIAPPGWDGSPRDPAVEAQMLKYAQCMRKNGVPQFSDSGAPNTGDFDPNSPQFKAAAQKCKSLQPRGAGG